MIDREMERGSRRPLNFWLFIYSVFIKSAKTDTKERKKASDGKLLTERIIQSRQ